MRSLSSVALIALVLGACDGGEIERANANVESANRIHQEADQLASTAAELQASAGSATEVADVKTHASSCTAKFDEASAQYAEAAKLAREAAAMKVTKLFAEYLELRAKQFDKEREAVEIYAGLCRSMAAAGSKDEALAGKDEALEKWRATRAEVDALAAKADAIEETNADRFQK